MLAGTCWEIVCQSFLFTFLAGRSPGSFVRMCILASSRLAHADRFKQRPDICAAMPAGSTDEPRLQEGERPLPALKLGEMAHIRVP